VADTHPTRKDENGEPVRLDLSFAPKMWLKAVHSREQSRMLVRRHFEAMAFACLVEEPRCGDVAVICAEDARQLILQLCHRVESSRVERGGAVSPRPGSEQQNGTAPYAAGFEEPVRRFRLVDRICRRDAEREDAGLGLVA